MRIRPASLADLPAITGIHNHYILNTHITFDVQPFVPAQREPWFRQHSETGRYRILVAEGPDSDVLGYAATSPFREKKAYETTVEVSIACQPDARGKEIGRLLYGELFRVL